jgi:acyl carrier protein
MNVMSTLTILQDILIRDYRLTRTQLGPEAELSTLGIDSLDMLELFFKIEERFGIKIWNEVPSTLRTMQDVVAYVDDLCVQQATARDASLVDHPTTPP